MLRRALVSLALVGCGSSIVAPPPADGSGSASGSSATGAAGGGASGGGASGGGASGGGASGGGSSSGGGGGAGAGGSGGSGGAPGFCGDGALDPGEACDDGNAADGDACAPDCSVTEFEITPPFPGNGVGEWPDVAATGFDGGQGFLVVWRDAVPLFGRTVTAKGALGEPGELMQSGGLPGVVGLAGGEALVAQRISPDAFDLAIVDASTLAESAALEVPTAGDYWYVELARSDVGEVATAHAGDPPGPISSKPVQGCVLHPAVACFSLGSTEPTGIPSISIRDGSFVAVFGTPGGLRFVSFGAAGVIESLDVDEAATAVASPHLARRPGGHVLAWSRANEPCVHVRTFDDGFAEPFAPAVIVDGSCDGDEVYGPRVATGPTGRFVVTYWRFVTPANFAPFACEVQAQVFEADATPSGPPFVVAAGSTWCDGYVRVAANPAGDVLFVFNRDDAVTDTVRAKLFPRLLE